MRGRVSVSPRAVALLALGVVGLVAAWGFGAAALSVLAIGLLALPVLAGLVVGAAAAGLRVDREVEPARVRAGDACRVRVVATGWPGRLGLLAPLDLVAESGAGELGMAVTGRWRRAPGGWERPARVPEVSRGAHRLPPPAVTLRDPFGLVTAVRRGTAEGTVLAVPAAPDLAAPFWLGAGGRALGTGATGPARRGEEIEGVRDYRPGDPLSRVHWPQTARRGRLQAKELSGSGAGGESVAILLDARRAPGIEGKPHGPFEVAVSAAAALARHLDARRASVELEHAGRPPRRVALARGGWPAAEAELARVEADGEMPLGGLLRAVCARDPRPPLAVLVTAAPEPGLAEAVRAARDAGVAVACVLVGAAAAEGPALSRAGAVTTTVAGIADLAEALSAERRHVA
jgi:uncharacterized protein (DUF58 family)